MQEDLYTASARMKILVSVGFVTHVALGSFCMMPMAYAAPMPMQHEEEAMEMNMTPMIPMSPLHCEHCIHVDQQNENPMNGSCAGHCLAKAHDSLAAVSVSFGHQTVLALPPAFSIAVEPAYVSVVYNTSKAPPINLVAARGVVMIN